MEANNFEAGRSIFYWRIMGNARDRATDAYTERHHAVPRSLGGSNAYTNIVRLTAREHLIAHRLLIRMTAGKERAKMVFALQCMTWESPKHRGKRTQLTLKQHAWLREQVAKSRQGTKWTAEQRENQSLRKRGLLPPKVKVKRVMSEAQKAKISASTKGKSRPPHSAETKAKLSKIRTGTKMPPKSEQERRNISERMKGHIVTAETRARISKTRKERYGKL